MGLRTKTENRKYDINKKIFDVEIKTEYYPDLRMEFGHRQLTFFITNQLDQTPFYIDDDKKLFKLSKLFQKTLDQHSGIDQNCYGELFIYYSVNMREKQKINKKLIKKLIKIAEQTLNIKII